VSKPPPSFQPNRSSTQTPSHRDDLKNKNLERDNNNKGPESSRISSTTKCYKCQGYRLVRITIIDGIPTEVTESDFDVYNFKGEDSETDEELISDNVGLNCIN